jgi:Ca2+-transporting ATPase
MQTLLGKHWHHLANDEIVELLCSNQQTGIDLFEARHRLERFGRNVLTPKKGKSPLMRFLLQFHNPLIYILLASSAITAIIKDISDAFVILAVVIVNAIIGYAQEARAEKAIEALAHAMTTEASVLRGGKTQRISAAELVPGDIVQLKSGDKVPADLRLLSGRDLQVAEAALTGESAPVQKDPALRLDPETILAERRNMAYASSLVTYGQATGIVTATGDNTEVGRISQLIASAEALETPLTKKIAQFSNVIVYVILFLAAVAFVIGLWRGQNVIETFTAAIAIAVAMIPEGLPAALTVTLAIGVSRMAKRRAIIRKLPAVEALGSTTVICSDKTGTLTQNQMTVQQIITQQNRYQVSGAGYNPTGQITRDGQAFLPPANSALAETLTAGLLCNDAELHAQPDGSWQTSGDPTEIGLVVSAFKGGFDNTLRQSQPRLDAIPFESQHQYMGTLHTLADGQRVVYVKGAVEALLERCTGALDETGQVIPLDADLIHRQVDEMARRGLRVLAFARQPFAAGNQLCHEHIASGLTFLGLQAMIDPARPEAIAAVQACQRAGIRVKMITGDHALTASAIAAQIGLQGNLQAMTGKAMSALTDEQLIQAAEERAVFARVSPEQKLRLVDALQSLGNVVAMTGDGVNDGPALKQADIGVAMGITGTDVAKEAADMVLTDDNFATIEAAVEEGRGVFDNLTKIIAWTLPTNLGQGMIIVLALLLGAQLPILPIQILWINLVSVGALGIVLALENREPGIMLRPPRRPDSPILTNELLWRVLLVGILILVGAFGLFELTLLKGAGIAEARTAAVNAVMFIGAFYLLNCRSLRYSMFQIGVFGNRWLWVSMAALILLQLAFTYMPVMNSFFYSAPISALAWLEILGMGVLTYAIVEVEKWLRRRGEMG